jgi:hypothetical protein
MLHFFFPVLQQHLQSLHIVPATVEEIVLFRRILFQVKKIFTDFVSLFEPDVFQRAVSYGLSRSVSSSGTPKKRAFLNGLILFHRPQNIDPVERAIPHRTSACGSNDRARKIHRDARLIRYGGFREYAGPSCYTWYVYAAFEEIAFVAGVR